MVHSRRKVVTRFEYREGKITVFYNPSPTVQCPPELGEGWCIKVSWDEEESFQGPFFNEDQARLTGMATASSRRVQKEQNPIWGDRQKKRRL